jgi:uncharacterized delta-60 repeat protein
MGSRLLFLCGLLSVVARVPLLKAQAVDPSFKPTTLSVPGNVRCAVQQGDGKYVVLGSFRRSERGSLGSVVRFNADFTPDQSFNNTVAPLTGTLYSIRTLASGKLLIVGDGTLTLAGVSRQDLLRLNADGTPDATFDAGTASATGYGSVVEPLANGQLLVGGSFTNYNGVARSKLVRLTSTGSVDATFAPAGLTATVKRVAVQADGKVLVGGDEGLGLLRLTTTGSADGSFSAPEISETDDIVVQPDGNILVGGSYFPTYDYGAHLVRLLPNGSRDTSFLSNADFTPFNTTDQRLLLLQADGRLLVVGADKSLHRVMSNGSFDNTFQPPFSSQSAIAWLAPTATGQALVAGGNFQLPNHRSSLALLNVNGTLDTRFAPTLLTNGYIYALTQQADGKILAGGHFDEINGQPVNNLARFAVDGTLDASFVAPPWLDVQQVVVQPDGKVLVAQFGRTSQPSVLRLLATGAVDASFAAPAQINRVNQVLLQSDGRYLVLADTLGYGNTLPIRLLATGQRDRTFATLLNGNYDIASSATLQTDNKLVVAGTIGATQTKSTIRLLATGQRDPSFTELSIDDAPNASTVVAQPDGKILFVDEFYSRLRRLMPNGQLDASFTSALPPGLDIFTIRPQPDNRIVVGGAPRYLARLLADGSLDSSFNSPAPNSTVTDVSFLSTGQLLVSGSFSVIGGQERVGLVRLTTDRPLAVAASQAAIRTDAYPNPAHNALHLLLDSNAQPQRVVLANMLGQTVLTQDSPLAYTTLNTTSLSPGTYLLQVKYASGTVTRRILIN